MRDSVSLALCLLVLHAANAKTFPSVLDDLTRFHLGMSYSELKRIRPNVHVNTSMDESDQRASDTVPSKGEVLVGESLPENDWFAVALYGIVNGKMDSMGFTADISWDKDRTLRCARGALNQIVGRYGSPTERALLNLDIFGNGKTEVLQVVWKVKGTLLILNLPTPKAGKFANRVYVFHMTSEKTPDQWFDGRQSLSAKELATRFSDAGYRIDSKNAVHKKRP